MHYRNFLFEKIVRPILLKNKLLNPLVIELSLASNHSSTKAVDLFEKLNNQQIDLTSSLAEFESLNSNLVLRKNSFKQEYPKTYDIADEFSLLIYLAVRTYHPSTVLETGVANGVSTYYILNAMSYNNKGTLYSTDIANDVGGLLNDEERKRWNLRILKKRAFNSNFKQLIRELPSIDMFIHDSDHTFDGQWLEYSQVFPKMTNSSIFMSDDIDMSYAFMRFCSNIGIKPLVLVTPQKVSGLFQKT